MRNTFLPFSPPLLGEDEINEVIDTLRSAWITTGPKVRRFEQEFAAFIGSMAALAVSSATDVRCDAGTIGKKIDVEAPTTAAVLIGIPRDVMHTARMSAGDMKRELALALFRQDRLSFGKARELAGMTVWAFQQLLGSFSCRGGATADGNVGRVANPSYELISRAASTGIRKLLRAAFGGGSGRGDRHFGRFRVCGC